MEIPGYTISRELDKGGMSTVYLATQNSVGREVALKVMSLELNTDEDFGERFQREAKIVGQLSHPHIVVIYDIGVHNGYNYISMDLLTGGSLADVIHSISQTTRSLQILRDIASALDYANSQGYIHRDIKPSNILFRSDGAAVLTDFGIAKSLQCDNNTTMAGIVMGTPNYMSPEQSTGKPLDGRSDLYSLGVVFYQMLTGSLPYEGEDSIVVALQHITSPIPSLPLTLKKYQPLLNKLMAKDAHNRFANGAAVIAAIDSLDNELTVFSGGYAKFSGSLRNAYSNVATLTKTGKTILTGSYPKKQTSNLDATRVFEADTLEAKSIDIPAVKPKKGAAVAIALIIIGTMIIFSIAFLQPEQGLEPNIATNDLPVITDNSPLPSAENPLLITDDKKSLPPIEMTASPETSTLRITEALPVAKPLVFALTVRPIPDTAIVRVLSIKEKYKPGMLLKPGAYHVDIKAKNHLTRKFWVTIKDASLTIEGRLKPLQAGLLIVDKIGKSLVAPTVVVLPTLPSGKDLAMTRTEVTFKDYNFFAKNTGRVMPNDNGWGLDDRPVVNVSWNDASAYAAWLSKKSGYKYRIPNTSEWEWAAAAGSLENYWWQAGDGSGMANCRSGCKSEFAGFFTSKTAPVATYKPNPYGLFDTAGNVSEWITGCAGTQKNTPANTPCPKRQHKGGSAKKSIKSLAVREVDNKTSGKADKFIGIRLVRELN
jgi:serine/threonine-protein kinase PpkA